MLKGEKITLRPVRLDDWGKTIAWRNDLFLKASTMSHPFPVTDEQEMNWYREKISQKNNKFLPFTCCDIKTNEVVGIFSLNNIDWISRNCIVSGIIGERSNFGKGMGREAVVLLIRYAFDHLNLEKVFAYVRADHPAKETWIETGAVSEGVLKNHFYSEGEFRDVHVLSWFKGCLRK